MTWDVFWLRVLTSCFVCFLFASHYFYYFILFLGHDGEKKQKTQSPVCCPLRNTSSFTPAASALKKHQRPLIFIQYVYSSVDSITLIKTTATTTKMYNIYKVGLFHAQLEAGLSGDAGLGIIHNQRNEKKRKHGKPLQTSSHDSRQDTAAALRTAAGFYASDVWVWDTELTEACQDAADGAGLNQGQVSLKVLISLVCHRG